MGCFTWGLQQHKYSLGLFRCEPLFHLFFFDAIHLKCFKVGPYKLFQDGVFDGKHVENVNLQKWEEKAKGGSLHI